MSAQAHNPAVPGTIDVTGTPGIPFLRLFKVELRKAFDTRAGRWLVGVTAGIALVADVIIAIVVGAQNQDLAYGDLVAGAAFVCSILLPVLGIMLVTSEWSQRTAMTTFALEPRRMRIVLAKMLAGVALTAFVIAFALVVGVLCNLLYGRLRRIAGLDLRLDRVPRLHRDPDHGHARRLRTGLPGAEHAGRHRGLLRLQVGAARVSSPSGAALMAWFNDLVDWIDFQSAQNLLYDGGMSAADWWHLVVSGFIWLVVPLAIGLWRIQRAEVK